MAALEIQKNGTPHLHVLQRGTYIPQRWLSAAWLSLTGSFKVYIEKVNHVEGAVDELTKYLCKTAAQVQAACPGRPLWTMSRNWLPADFDDKSDREPRDPYACHFRLAMADVEWVLEKLDAFLEEVPDRPYHYAVKWRSMPDPAFLSTCRYMEGSQEYWFAYYLLWREGALDCPDRHAILELAHYGHLTISPPAQQDVPALRAA